MLARELINDSYPPLKPVDSGLKALRWMDMFKLEHIPIVEGTKYIGLITEQDVLRLNSMEQPIGDQITTLINPFIKSSQPLYEVVKVMSKDRLSVVPVVDEKHNYLGCITLGDLLHHYRDSGIFEESTGIIILEMKPQDYALSRIAHLVEAEDAKVLSAFTKMDMENEMMDVTLRINQADLTRILASFSRHGIDVKEHYNQSEMAEDLKTRYDSLIKYLET